MEKLKQPLTYAQLNQIKLKPSFGAFYAIQLGNRSGLFYSSRGLNPW